MPWSFDREILGRRSSTPSQLSASGAMAIQPVRGVVGTQRSVGTRLFIVGAVLANVEMLCEGDARCNATIAL